MTRWFAHRRRHNAVYAAAHVCAILLASYVIATSVPAVAYHWEKI